jgi:eukaryotic-like serine/threonine-protein kinase
MLCPFCGSTSVHSSGACPVCGRTLPPPALPGEEPMLSRPPSVVHADDLLTQPIRSFSASGVSRPASTGPIDAGQIVNGRYHVIRLLGRGGMGAVYHAWDEELGVGVALKVILPGDIEAPDVVDEMERRFKKELLLARQITHRNVVRIHDLGEVDGVKFITMPYIKGQDLATMLKGGALPIGRALALARQLASGLAAAHDAGVVHRDLKPANVMVEEGDWALLMDFGIARSVHGGSSQATLPGTVVGTIDYMAPEQARGEMVDARADIYAFGLIFYEMLTGRRHLTGDGSVSDLVARMSAAPPPVRTLRAEIPAPLDAIVTRCVQPKPDDRYASCGELIAALEGLDTEGRAVVRPEPRAVSSRLIAGAVAVLMGVSGGAYWTASRRAAPASAVARAPVSVLIANFENKAGDPAFDGTLEQALGLALEGAPFISSYSRQTAQRVAAQVVPGATLDEANARLVSKREGIRVVLAGAVAREDGAYVLTVRALEGADGRELSVARATADSKDQVLAAVSSVANNVRRALGDATPESEMGGAETFTASSLEAAHAYEQAQQLQRAGDTGGAIAAYKRVIALDPGLGRAYAGLAAVYANTGQVEEAKRQYELALERLDRMTERERFRTRSSYFLFTRNPERASDELTALVEKYPADTAGLGNLAFAWFLRRDMTRALEVGRKATAVYPENVLQRTNVALYAMYAGDFESATTEARAALAINAKHGKAMLALAISELASGRSDGATAIYESLRPISPSLAAQGLADVALFEGRATEAASLLERGAETDRTTGNTAAAARKLTAVAEARRLQGRGAEAARLAAQAVAATPAFEVKVEAARVYLDLGMLKEASAVADSLRTSLQTDPQAYARVIDGFVLIGRKQPAAAVIAFTEAQKLADTWLGRFGLGRAYLEAGAYPEAEAAFAACLRRRGEATALYLDDVPTYRVFPPVHYYLGRAQEALRSSGARESFRTFLAIKQRGTDPLAADARSRLAGLGGD